MECGTLNRQMSKDFEDVYLAARYYIPFIWSRQAEILSDLYLLASRIMERKQVLLSVIFTEKIRGKGS